MKKSKFSTGHIQMMFRCTPELHGMIVQALGIAIYKSGKAISKNDFIVHLLTMGLKESGLSEIGRPSNDVANSKLA